PSAQAGAAPPALLVEKNTGSIRAKSFSSRMRCMRTEPTMPRQPTRPTACVMFNALEVDKRKKPSIPTIYQNAGSNVALHAKKSGPDASAHRGGAGCLGAAKVPDTLRRPSAYCRRVSGVSGTSHAGVRHLPANAGRADARVSPAP